MEGLEIELIIIFIITFIILIVAFVSEEKDKIKKEKIRDEEFNKIIANRKKYELINNTERETGIYCYIEEPNLDYLEDDSEDFTNKVDEKVKQRKIQLDRYKPNKKLKVLVGDYDIESISYTIMVLKSMGIETEVVKSGLEIYKKILDGNKYDIIITNNIYKTGKLDGYPLLLALKKIDGFNIPVIILTTADAGREVFVDEYGFSEYIAKKINQEQVSLIFPKLINYLKFDKIKEKM